MDNTIDTWSQGYFVDQPQYRNWSAEDKEDANARESLLVRPSPTDNAICQTFRPDQSEWIAQRLNMAAKLEALAYKLHYCGTTHDDKGWIACIDEIYRAVHLK